MFHPFAPGAHWPGFMVPHEVTVNNWKPLVCSDQITLFSAEIVISAHVLQLAFPVECYFSFACVFFSFLPKCNGAHMVSCVVFLNGN